MTETPLEKWRRENPDAEVVQRSWWEKFREKPTRSSAISAFCTSCVGHEEGKDPPPGMRTDIKNCSAEKTCPLWAFRPYR